ncbi:MAG: hypothetical protein DCC75_08665 [Proteobacteria bacterium]|nr:MAG: hypothetical protein DCC75_08665 [Pseudomonadota bacterium]
MNSQPLAQLRSRIRTAVVLSIAIAALLAFSWYSCLGKMLLVAAGLILVAAACWETSSFSKVSLDLVRRATLFLVLLFPSLLSGGMLAPELCDPFPAPQMALAYAYLGTSIAFVLLITMQVTLARSAPDLAGELSREIYLALILLGFGGASLLALPYLGLGHLAWLIIVVSVNDIAAYSIGSKLGGPRLAPNISPSKTVSGSLAGLLAGILFGMVLAPVFLDVSSRVFLGAALVLLVLAAQSGDLAKSYLKRLGQVKDSGTLLPGHGGVLDRIDGYLGAAPILLSLAALGWL